MQYQPELMKLYHDKGMKVITWTVDEPADIRDMLRLGADGIISNRADVLCRTVQEACGGQAAGTF